MKSLKCIKKLLALTVSAAMLTLLPNVNVLTASADEPVTYYLMYSEENEEWLYQVGSVWNDNGESSSSFYLQEKIKNGDTVVIGNGSYTALTFNVHLSNLTINNRSDVIAMVSVTGGIDNCYFNSGTHGAVTGSVTNAYVYGVSRANFNSNVGNLYSYEHDSESGPTIGVTGTVSYFVDENADGSRGYYGTNFAADSFVLTNGVLETDSEKYTQDISGGPASSSAQPVAAQTTTSGASSDEYDEVPKTGEISFALWLCLAAAVSFSGSLLLRRLEK